MQEDLRQIKGNGETLTKGAHQALADFRWMAQSLERFPTRLYKLVPLQPTLEGCHGASGYMCGGRGIPGPNTVPRTLKPHPSATKPTPYPTGEHPIV